VRFSQRIGKRPVRVGLQTDEIDHDLRVVLFNMYKITFIDPFLIQTTAGTARQRLERIWAAGLTRPLDEVPYGYDASLRFFKPYILQGDWADVYELFDFCVGVTGSDDLEAILNSVLEQGCSGYRFVDHQLTPITDEIEIGAIEDALQTRDARLKHARNHLEEALAKLSARKNPDYRNSIKESISAVESAVSLLAGSDKATFDQALRVLDAKGDVHPALKQAFSKLYGYTSDASGVRHCMTEEPTVGLEEAKYMLVSCAAFINYLNGKAAT
jgi:hypothetical protein